MRNKQSRLMGKSRHSAQNKDARVDFHSGKMKKKIKEEGQKCRRICSTPRLGRPREERLMTVSFEIKRQWETGESSKCTYMMQDCKCTSRYAYVDNYNKYFSGLCPNNKDILLRYFYESSRHRLRAAANTTGFTIFKGVINFIDRMHSIPVIGYQKDESSMEQSYFHRCTSNLAASKWICRLKRQFFYLFAFEKQVDHGRQIISLW